MDAFLDAFSWTVGVEGGFDNSARDPGNWTGGAIGEGILKGTKYGISAASYPNLNIASLTLDQAEAIYRQDYWAKIPAYLSYWISRAVFDGAVNHGVERSIILLQTAIKTTPDGVFGPESQAAYQAMDEIDIYFSYLNQRLILYRGLSDFTYFAAGWFGRLLALAKLYAGRE